MGLITGAIFAATAPNSFLTPFFTKLGFFSGMSPQLALSKIAGISIITGASILRVPQIMRIYKNKSTEGISPSMFYLDNIIMLQTLGFSLAHKIPFSVYGENFMMCI